jgi:hypothetical protein
MGSQNLIVSLMDADPNRYRCSPERLKKAWSSQDEVSTHVRQGRRQSGMLSIGQQALLRTLDGQGAICSNIRDCHPHLSKNLGKDSGRFSGYLQNILSLGSSRPLLGTTGASCPPGLAAHLLKALRVLVYLGLCTCS